jgi:cyclophilin family peptidyl-prolyl cis-trans isomerase
MLERTGWGASRRGGRAARVSRAARLGLDPLEGRALMAATLAPIANVTAPAGIGYQVPLDGTGGGASQTYTVASSNSAIKATVAQGQFMTLNVTHTSSGANDPAFTGTLVFQLFDDLVPQATSKIEQLVSSGFYTNTHNNASSIFRVASGFPDSTGFIAQGGAVSVTNGEGTDSPPAPGQPGGLPATGFPFQNQFNQSLAFTNPGQLAMANAGFTAASINTADYFTNSSQFFVTNEAPRFLDSTYTIFGQLVSGFDTLAKINAVPTTTNGSGEKSLPQGAITITSASLSTTSPDGVVHIDATGATAGETSNVVVTAFDPSTNTTTSQSFTVTVGPTNPNPGPTQKPFLNVYPDINTPIQTSAGQPAVFQVQGISPGFPTDPLTYAVFGPNTANTAGSAPVLGTIQNGTASVNANGVVTVTPNPGFTGNITVMVGVRDQTGRSSSTLDTPSNFDIKQFTVQVNPSTTPVDRTPIAQPVTVSASSGAPMTIQLNGLSATTGTNQNLTYTIATQPAHGTLTNLNATAGTVTYTPNPNFTGTDTFTYTVTDNGNTTNTTSAPGTVTVNVTSGVTGAVRLITGANTSTLVVTPPPNKVRHQNQIAVSETAAGNIQVEVNGVIDSTQPAASSLTEIVIYGATTGTSTVVAPNVDVPVSLDTGHGGTNFINYAGPADSQIRAWFGHSAVQGGSGTNTIVGRQNHLLKVVKSPGTDSVFLSGIDPYHRVPHWKASGYHHRPQNLGAFYKFVGNRLVKTNQPASVPFRQNKQT